MPEIVKKYLPVAVAALAGVLVGAFLLGGGSTSSPQGGSAGGGFSFKGGPSASSGQANCKTTEEKMTIVGESLAGIFKNGQQVRVIKNYYACNDANRGDIVVYSYAGNTNPIVKVVKAIPGDKFELKKSGSGPSTSSGQGWNILVNGSPAKTSDGIPYLVGETAYRLLSLYARDFERGGGAIAGGGHLILGDIPSGSLDSTTFGLVTKNDFLGKVVK